MKPSNIIPFPGPFQFDHPRGLAAPLTHDEYFTQALSLSSGLADCKGDGSPGTYGKRGGKLRKTKSLSSLRGQRWHNPAEQNKAARIDRLLRGALANALQPPPTLRLVSIKDLENQREQKGNEHQRARLELLTAHQAA